MSYQVALNKKYAVYPEYKPSGVEWVGEMPNQWLMVRTKFLFTRQQRSVRPEDDIVTAFRDGQVTLRKNRRTEGFTNALQEIGYQGIRKGDLIVHAMDAFAGAIGVSDSDGKSSPVYSVLTSKNVEETHTPYYGRLLRHMALSGFINSLAKGIRERSTEFRYSEVAELELPVPSIEEQRTIAAFLDYETARIDQLIAKQQRLIELLKEKRQAVISHAVTKGLNPNAPMKDSGVEWLGQVPEHWVVRQLKHVCNLLKDGTHLPPPRVDDGVPLLSVRNIIDGKFVFRSDDSNIAQKDYELLSKSFVPQKRDVLLAIVGGTLGKVAIVEDMGPFHIQRSLAIFRTTECKLVPELLMYIFSSQGFQSLLWEYVGFSAQPGIYLGTLANFSVPLAPLDEQSQIVSYCKTQTDKLDSLITKAKDMVCLLQERRTALISAAVTGKIDLRGWAPPAVGAVV